MLVPMDPDVEPVLWNSLPDPDDAPAPVEAPPAKGPHTCLTGEDDNAPNPVEPAQDETSEEVALPATVPVMAMAGAAPAPYPLAVPVTVDAPVSFGESGQETTDTAPAGAEPVAASGGTTPVAEGEPAERQAEHTAIESGARAIVQQAQSSESAAPPVVVTGAAGSSEPEHRAGAATIFKEVTGARPAASPVARQVGTLPQVAAPPMAGQRQGVAVAEPVALPTQSATGTNVAAPRTIEELPAPTSSSAGQVAEVAARTAAAELVIQTAAAGRTNSPQDGGKASAPASLARSAESVGRRGRTANGQAAAQAPLKSAGNVIARLLALSGQMPRTVEAAAPPEATPAAPRSDLKQPDAQASETQVRILNAGTPDRGEVAFGVRVQAGAAPAATPKAALTAPAGQAEMTTTPASAAELIATAAGPVAPANQPRTVEEGQTRTFARQPGSTANDPAAAVEDLEERPEAVAAERNPDRAAERDRRERRPEAAPTEPRPDGLSLLNDPAQATPKFHPHAAGSVVPKTEIASAAGRKRASSRPEAARSGGARHDPGNAAYRCGSRCEIRNHRRGTARRSAAFGARGRTQADRAYAGCAAGRHAAGELAGAA